MSGIDHALHLLEGQLAPGWHITSIESLEAGGWYVETLGGWCVTVESDGWETWRERSFQWGGSIREATLRLAWSIRRVRRRPRTSSTLRSKAPASFSARPTSSPAARSARTRPSDSSMAKSSGMRCWHDPRAAPRHPRRGTGGVGVSDQDWYCYVAFPTDCRCVAAVCVDEPDHRSDVAKFTAAQVRKGHILERMRGDAFRELPFRCPQHPGGRWSPQPPQQGLGL